MSDHLIGGVAARDRIERILRGEEIARLVASDAGTIPRYYGARAMASDVCVTWLLIWRNSVLDGKMRPGDEAFYQSNAIGWASR